MGDRTQRFEGLSPTAATRSLHKAESQSPGLASLRALEHYAHQEVNRLPPNSIERTNAYRHIFNQIIATLPAHGPLLAEIKLHYERALEAANAAAARPARPSFRGDDHATPPSAAPPADAFTPGSPGSPSPNAVLSFSPSHGTGIGTGIRLGATSAAESSAAVLRATHPLQYPASYYEAQWRKTQWEVQLRTREVARLEAMQHVLELRLSGLTKLNESLSKSSVATRTMAEEIMEEAQDLTRCANMNPAFVALEIAKAQAAGTEVPKDIAGAQDLGAKAGSAEKSLMALLKMLRRQELHVADATRLLEQHIDWEDSRGVDMLRQLVGNL